MYNLSMLNGLWCLYSADIVSQMVNFKAINRHIWHRDLAMIFLYCWYESHAIAVKTAGCDTYRNLQRHRAVLPATARLFLLVSWRLTMSHCNLTWDLPCSSGERRAVKTHVVRKRTKICFYSTLTPPISWHCRSAWQLQTCRHNGSKSDYIQLATRPR